jgi:hypothetical protein
VGWGGGFSSLAARGSAEDGPMPRSGWMNPMRVAVAVVDMLVLRYPCQLTGEEDKLPCLAPDGLDCSTLDLSRECNER